MWSRDCVGFYNTILNHFVKQKSALFIPKELIWIWSIGSNSDMGNLFYDNEAPPHLVSPVSLLVFHVPLYHKKSVQIYRQKSNEVHLIFMAHSPSHDLIYHRVQFSKKVITLLWQRQKKNPISVRPRVCLLTHFLLHVPLMQKTLQPPVTQIWGSAVVSKLRLFVWRKKSQSLCQHWSWFTWTLAQKKINFIVSSFI